MGALYFLAGLFITLSVLIFVHEFGHFVAAKRAGVRVERFSIGFGPAILKFRRGETDYVVAVVPFGGYVRMAGEDPDQPSSGANWEFMSKSKKTRAAIVSAGPGMNFMLSVVILAILAVAMGVEKQPQARIGKVLPDSPAEKAGLMEGDLILMVGKDRILDWYGLLSALEGNTGGSVGLVVERGTLQDTTTIDLSGISQISEVGITLFREPVIGGVAWRGPAHKAGLRAGDRVISVGGVEVKNWDNLREVVVSHPADTLELVWQRDGKVMSGRVVPKDAGGYGLIEVTVRIERERLGIARSIGIALDMSIWAASQIRQIGKFFMGLIGVAPSSDAIGGPIRIGEVAGDALRWGLPNFLWFIALVSAQLSIINLIPIPVLDGGHILLLAIETVNRRPVSQRQRIIANQIGFAFLVGFMVLVTFHDIMRIASR
ncbi:MAG: RIP metalloprotease RseP [bacterium]